MKTPQINESTSVLEKPAPSAQVESALDALGELAEGLMAFEDNLLISDNPHPKNSNDFQNWQSGWISGQEIHAAKENLSCSPK